MHKVALGAVAAILALLAAPAAHAQMSVTSDDIKDGAVSPKSMEANVFGCNGGNLSPSLKWTGAPDGTKSFAINLYDPDAPTGSGFWHWVVFNIPVSTTSLPTDAGNVKKELMPKGAIQARNDYGFWGFGGTCPPQDNNVHHYTLTVYAVDEDKLQFAKDEQVPAPVVGFELHYHTKAKAALHWTYSRAPEK
ncbi:MAG TPA: YbhB/YbcL family Raf kinase inhibitor-like protein [Xanthobacteraceae bacterium]|nr:YbhB/YbcL family Raf kinase inhibitor-like protein [Xanthobacteraceae bacterium]